MNENSNKGQPMNKTPDYKKQPEASRRPALDGKILPNIVCRLSTKVLSAPELKILLWYSSHNPDPKIYQACQKVCSDEMEKTPTQLSRIVKKLVAKDLLKVVAKGNYNVPIYAFVGWDSCIDELEKMSQKGPKLVPTPKPNLEQKCSKFDESSQHKCSRFDESSQQKCRCKLGKPSSYKNPLVYKGSEADSTPSQKAPILTAVLADPSKAKNPRKKSWQLATDKRLKPLLVRYGRKSLSKGDLILMNCFAGKFIKLKGVRRFNLFLDELENDDIVMAKLRRRPERFSIEQFLTKVYFNYLHLGLITD